MLRETKIYDKFSVYMTDEEIVECLSIDVNFDMNCEFVIVDGLDKYGEPTRKVLIIKI